MYLYLLILGFFISQNQHHHTITPVMPTLEMETEYVWNCIEQTRFFDDHGYEVTLPKGEIIHGLQVDARLGILDHSSKSDLKKFMKKQAYNPADYGPGMEKVKARIPDIQSMLMLIVDENYSWGFKLFPDYQVKLTLYGPGGSFDNLDGSILLFTTPDGHFKNYSDPANTLVHEIIHIGIEESIIQKYQVPHAMKERIVDKMVYLLYADVLHDYKVQDLGDHRIDPYLKHVDDIKKLDEAVQKALSQD